MKNLLINQMTTFLVFLAFLISTLLYNYLKNQAPTSSSRKLYGKLVVGWLSLTISSLFGLIRNFRPASYKLWHIWMLKLSFVTGTIGLIWIFMFVGKLYESELIWKGVYLVGWVIGLIGISLGVFHGGFEVSSSSFGVEVALPELVQLTTLVSFGSLLLLFAITALYFNFQMVNPKLKKKITRISLAYIAFWLFYAMEGTGVLFSLMKGIGLVVTRTLLMISAFITIIAWTGKKKFFEAFKNFFRFKEPKT